MTTATTTTTSSATQPADRILIIERLFDAPRELVWKAWTQPEHMAKWLGPKEFSGEIIKMDIRPGGSYRFRMRGPDGIDHWNQGVYREIKEPERLVYTFAWADAHGNQTRPETVLTLTFAEEGRRTRFTLHQAVFPNVDACNEHRSGWTSSLERLAEILRTSGASS